MPCLLRPENPYFRNSPVLIIEVTSPSTERIDHQEKLLAYQRIQSVQEYVVIDQNLIKLFYLIPSYLAMLLDTSAGQTI